MTFDEPKEAFPYKPPTEEIKNKYKSYFEKDFTPKPRYLKRAMDIFISLMVLIIDSGVHENDLNYR